ncbi:MAG: nucleotidyltransferase family protein, partial [Pseudobdellovibrio sp.]
MRSKVCILTAGHGLRLGDYTKFLNKALIPLKGKAVISHIIEKFPADSEFVIAVGHKREQVVDYLKLAHPNQKISIVNVDNYAGNGAGPGTSLLACREATNELPFYFVTCDTLWTDDVTKLPVNQSWWATAAIPEEETPSYCNALIKNGLVIGYRDKIFTRDETARAFTG